MANILPSLVNLLFPTYGGGGQKKAIGGGNFGVPPVPLTPPFAGGELPITPTGQPLAQYAGALAQPLTQALAQQAPTSGAQIGTPQQPIATIPPPTSPYVQSNVLPSDNFFAHTPDGRVDAAQMSQHTADVVPAPTPDMSLEGRLRERDRLLREGPDRQTSFWKRLLSGMARSVASADPQAGLAGLLGAAIGGGTAAAASKRAEAFMRLPQELQKVNAEVQTAQQVQQDKMAQQEALMKQEAERRKAVQEALKPYFDIIKERKIITPEQAAYLRQLTGLDYQPGDWRGSEIEVINGQLYVRTTNGERAPLYNTGLVKATDVPVNVDINGVPVAVLPKDALGAANATAAANQAAANRAEQNYFNARLRADLANQQAEMNTLGKRLQLLTEQAKTQSQLAGLQAPLESLKARAQQLANRYAELENVINQYGDNSLEGEAAKKEAAAIDKEAAKVHAEMSKLVGKNAELKNYYDQIAATQVPSPPKVAVPQRPPTYYRSITVVPPPTSQSGGQGGTAPQPEQPQPQQNTTPAIQPPPKAELEAELRRRGIKPNSKQWKVVMKRAGY